jgi:undecaprenyl-diphosphatase
MDNTLLFLINRQWTNAFLDRLMATFTSFDVWMPFLFILGLLLLWLGGFRMRSFIIVTLLTIAFTDGVVTQFGKQLVNRPRPTQALADVREVSLENTHPAFLGVFRPVKVAISPAPTGAVIGRSFPSGHAMNNTVIGTLAILFFGRWGCLYLLPAAVVAYSRVYCGSHWPSDVIVSAVLGIGFSLILVCLFSYLYQQLASRWLPRLYAKYPVLLMSSAS